MADKRDDGFWSDFLEFSGFAALALVALSVLINGAIVVFARVPRLEGRVRALEEAAKKAAVQSEAK